MKRRIFRWAARVVGVALIALVLWMVGWNDTVTDRGGVEHVGRVVSETSTQVVLRTDEGEQTILVDGPAAVRGGLGTAFRKLGRQPGAAAVGALLHLVALLFTMFRWGVLLEGAELKTPLGTVMKLGFLGQFFASVLPGGQAAGDLVKAFYVARTHSGRRTRSVMTVFADRALGLLILCCIAAGAVLLGPGGSRIDAARNVLLVGVILGGLGVAVLFSARIRKLLRVRELLDKLPFQHVVEEMRLAAWIYGARPRFLLISSALTIAGQGIFLSAFYFYGKALGAPLPGMAIVVAVPVALMMSAIPGLPGGWGVGDFAFLFFLGGFGVEPAQAVAISFTFRIIQTLLCLPGGLFLAQSGYVTDDEPVPS